MNLIFHIRRLVYITLGLFDQIVSRKNNLVVLCYHSINKDGWRYGVSLSDLKKQINYLSKNNHFISIDDLHLFINGKKVLAGPSVLITFDDGYKDILSTVEFFEKKNIKPTVFVVANPKQVNRAQLQTERDLLSDKDIKFLQKKGWIIGNHSMTHADFSTLSTTQKLTDEIINSKRVLERSIGDKINYFAYPKGVYNGLILSSIQKGGYKLAFSMDEGIVISRTHKYIIPRVGVDRSHTFIEFKYLASPSVLLFRRVVKKFLGGII